MNPFANVYSEWSSPSKNFKATNLWNEMVYAFCYGVPVKRHRRHFRHYDDCFVSKDAVDWVHHYLMASPFFEHHDVQREQAVQLLRKFVRFEIMKKVDAKEGKLYEFTDNKDLYCFTSIVTEKMPMQPAPRPIGGKITPAFWRWHEIVYAFWVGMPISRHLKNLKIYEDCFVAKYAVNWIHHYLIVCPYFKQRQLSRFQAVQLLRKFVRYDVIKKVDAKEGEVYEFSDNRDLYSFTQLC